MRGGRVVISSSDQMPLLIGSSPARKPDGIDDPLEANLVVLRDADGAPVLLGQIDTLFVDARTCSEIARRVGVEESRLVLIASHTHSAPALTADVGHEGDLSEEHWHETIACIAAGFQRLLAQDSTPAAVAMAQSSPGFNVSRRKRGWFLDTPALKSGRLRLRRSVELQPNPAGIVDPALRVLTLRNEAGHCLAVIWGYAAHPSRYPRRSRVSADFPGVVRRRLREELGGDLPVLYLPGFAGSTAPAVPWTLPSTPGQMVRALVPLLPYSPSFTDMTFRRWSGKLADAAVALAKEASPQHALAVSLNAVRSRPIMRCADQGRDVMLDIRVLRLGSRLSLLALSGEMLAEWMPLLGDPISRGVWPTGYLAGRPTYVPPRHVIEEGGYEAEGFKTYFKLQGAFAEDIDRVVTEAIRAACPASGKG